MSEYTQCRGWLNVNSIQWDVLDELKLRLEAAKYDFQNQHKDDGLRSWVCRDTTFQSGSNCSAFIFFGTELKNNDSPAEKWIEFLLTYFPNAEGCISFQKGNNDNKIWIIVGGKIEEEEHIFLPFKGYGNAVSI